MRRVRAYGGQWRDKHCVSPSVCVTSPLRRIISTHLCFLARFSISPGGCRISNVTCTFDSLRDAIRVRTAKQFSLTSANIFTVNSTLLIEATAASASQSALNLARSSLLQIASSSLQMPNSLISMSGSSLIVTFSEIGDGHSLNLVADDSSVSLDDSSTLSVASLRVTRSQLISSSGSLVEAQTVAVANASVFLEGFSSLNAQSASFDNSSLTMSDSSVSIDGVRD